MKIEQFTRILWDTLVVEDENHQNHFRVGDDYIQEWSFHTSEFQFMRTFHEKNHACLRKVCEEDVKKYNQGKLKVIKYEAYGRTFGYGIYCCCNTQYIILRRSDLIAIYDHFVDEAQTMKEERYGSRATPRRPYFMERFKQTETFLQWMRDPNRIHL